MESRISKSEKFPPCCVPIENKGEGIFHFLENFQKSQVLECSEKLKNEVLSNLEGVDFWSPESQKVKNFPPCCVPIDNKGGIFHRIELMSKIYAHAPMTILGANAILILRSP